jgi:DNA-binding NarL/FixJ family response regulator
VADKKQDRKEQDKGARLLVLPCVDSTVGSSYFSGLQSAQAIRLLPVALASTLSFRISSDQPDVIVIATEDFTGWRNSESLTESLANTPTVLLTTEVSGRLKKQASRLHIHSLLPLDVSVHQLLTAIAGTAAGLAVGLAQADSVLPDWNESADEEQLFTEHLTAREMEVLRLMASGHGNKRIAAILHISEHTAKFHVSSVLAKLGATSRTEAVTLGITRGLVAI